MGKIFGQRVPMVDAKEKVMGRAVYLDDLEFPGMLYGKTLRSPYPHARILNIDTSRAERLPGVKAVVTAKDTSQNKFGYSIIDQVIFAQDKVRFCGEEVAAVAATDPNIAQEALGLMKVDYEELPAVFTMEEAVMEGAPLLHQAEKNIAKELTITRGDIEKSWEKCAVILEETFETSHVHPGYIEPQGCIALFDYSGRLHIYAGNQNPARTRSKVSDALGLPMGKIHFVQVLTGGAFGGKTHQQVIFTASVLARKAKGYPIKMVLDRSEDFATTLYRVGMKIRLKMGADKEGHVLAKEMDVLADNGAYSANAPVVADTAATRVDSLYRFESVKTACRLVYTNKPTSGMFRGFGNPQSTFAVECMMDMLAYKLHIDPVEIRLKNAVQCGDVSIHGWKIKSCELADCIKKASQAAMWQEKKANPIKGKGLGIGCVIHVSGNRSVFPPFDGSSAMVRINEDGEADVTCADGDIGQGMNTVSAQIAAEILGFTMDQVRVNRVDSDQAGFGLGASASRVTTLGGNAVRLAAEDAKGQLLDQASDILKISMEDLIIQNGMIYVRNDPGKSLITVAEVARQAVYRSGGQYIIGRGGYLPPDVERADPQTKYGNISCAYSFGAHIAEVEVDTETGKVKVLNYIAAHDSGQIVNPTLAEGQVEGGVVQGLGFALYENMHFQNGKMLNDGYLDYKIPLALDIPPIKTIFADSYDPNGPLGAKGLGEPTIVPVASAISNAIYDAVGVRLTKLPFTPERIKEALAKKDRL